MLAVRACVGVGPRLLRYPILIIILLGQAVYADTAPTDQRFSTFLQFLKERDAARHYILASKQSAIHKMLIGECMRGRGFEDRANSDPSEWFKALNGEFAYCHDHHIPGIDPPCPSEKVVESSVNNSCWQLAANQIDRSSAILHAARKRAVADTRKDPSDAEMHKIESAWSKCMASEGYLYSTRTDMYASYGSVDLRDEERAALPDRDEVMYVAEVCYHRTKYREQYKALFNVRNKSLVAKNRGALFDLFERYEKAEHDAQEYIIQYCANKRDEFIRMYNMDKLTDKKICEDSEQD